jgi:hypothetical protein
VISMSVTTTIVVTSLSAATKISVLI